MFHSISGFSSTKKGYRKTQKKLGLLNPPSYLRLSPKKYQFFWRLPIIYNISSTNSRRCFVELSAFIPKALHKYSLTPLDLDFDTGQPPDSLSHDLLRGNSAMSTGILLWVTSSQFSMNFLFDENQKIPICFFLGWWLWGLGYVSKYMLSWYFCQSWTNKKNKLFR